MKLHTNNSPADILTFYTGFVQNSALNDIRLRFSYIIPSPSNRGTYKCAHLTGKLDT